MIWYRTSCLLRISSNPGQLSLAIPPWVAQCVVATAMVMGTIVRDFLYPALDCPPATLCFTDQYALRPSGSTTAALVALLNSVTQALENNTYVIVVALDFSKAFDTVRHSSAMAKVASITGLRTQLASQLHRRTQSLHTVQRLHVRLT